MSKYKFNSSLGKIKILSLDIFDTLLFRTVIQPVDIFEKVWEKYTVNDNCENVLSPNEFKILRIEAEKKARNIKRKTKDSSEVNLRDIYEKLPRILKDKVEILADLELEVEKERCYINEQIYELIKLAKEKEIKVILTSDMYLSKEQIIQILLFNEFDLSLIDEIYVSNEFLKSKYEGELFEIIINRFNDIEPSQILHIGDNKVSDYEMPKKFGIKSLYYDVIPKKDNDFFYFEKLRYNSPLKEIESLRKLAVNSYGEQEESTRLKTAFEIGAGILGPFLTFFTEWVIRNIQQAKVDSVFPLMREGELLSQLLKNEINEGNLAIEVKPLYVSRKSTYIPSIKSIDKEIIEDMMQIKNLSVKNLFNMLGFCNTPDILKEFEKALVKDTFKIFKDNISIRQIIVNYLLEDEVKNKIDEFLEIKRNTLVEYLKQEIGNFNKAATIDIGFKGTIQKAIDKALINNDMDCNLHHFISMGSEDIENKVFEGININGFIGTFRENLNFIKAIMRSADVLEQLIIAPTGSTLDYYKVDDKVQPILGKYNNHNDEFKKYCWNGIFKFQELWFKFRKSKRDVSNKIINNKQQIVMILHRLLDMPTIKEANFIGELQYDDNFGSNNIEQLCCSNDEVIVKEKGIEYIDSIIPYGYKYLNIVWPQGVITKLDENYYLKKYLELNSYDEYFNAMRKIVEEIRFNNISEIVIYGAGEVGERLITACNLYNIKVVNIVDRKVSLWGEVKQGIEIISLKDAIEKGYSSFAIGSLAFIEEIKEAILREANLNSKNVNIFAVN